MSIQVRPQWPLLRHDPWLLSSLSWIPIVLAFSIWWIFSQGIVRDLPIGVVDLSHSQLSRQLIRDFDATSTMTVTHQFQDVNQAKTALIESDIYAYVVIPYQFDKSIFRGEQPQVSTFFNSQYILVGRLINSAIVQAQSTFNAQVDVVKNLATSQQTTLSAVGRAVPIRTQITPLFNLNTNYAQFLVSAVVPALWQIVVVVSTIMILAANHRHFGLQTWLGEKPLRILTLTLMRYLPIFMLQGIGFLIWFYQILMWPMHGSFALLIIAQLAMTLACMIMGALFFFLTLDPARAMSFAGAFTAPSFAFMGITFPVTDMNTLAQWWRSLLPVSHYIEVQVSQVSYNAELLSSLKYLVPMLGYALPLLLTLILIRKHKQAERINHD
ncbi:ABC transporter permease [Vibrio anguillarum]|uniref:ABC transporter permease n=1 Tax=Vibrio anguillarum TaxID=55601 RepID=A0AAW4AFQ9_VIBAN|nr:ABC transporter permease [Vibrio anguillarum]AEH32995.1 Export ABC transporter permease protein [Vibrio anguillarum 775]AGU57524.1 multidrug ABC transporter permease [Vibrio anguillarum M3]ARV28280.1 ABC-2 transporter family protein [Vibrio anguillarum]ASF92041.1 ABC transporter permease [Vibrio anguillarum]ATA49303.1 ABC transporter permease [Vibrio anguillarum]